MTWIVVVLILIGSSVLGTLWWRTQRQRTPLPSTAVPPGTGAPTAALDPTDPRRAAAEQILAQLQAATTALFGTEYLAASQVAAWQRADPQILAQAADRRWHHGLPSELRPVAEEACQPFRPTPDRSSPPHSRGGPPR